MNRAREEGFALVTTLWLVALLALVAVVIEGWITSSLEKATALQQRVNSDAALFGAADRVVFLMLKGGWSPRGLELLPRPAGDSADRFGTPGAGFAPDAAYIALDGRSYRLDDVIVRLQDEGGLFDLNNPDRTGLARLLAGEGVPRSSAQLMIDALIDYEKPVSNRQAVADDDYVRNGLPAPRHTRLLTPWEPYRIPGWPRQDVLWQGGATLADMVTTGPVGGINVNTSPANVLAAVTGTDEREAARVVAARTVEPITDFKDLPGGPTAIAGTEDRPLSVQPSSMIRLELRAPGDPLAHIVSVRLTSFATAPYRIDYAVALPQPRRHIDERPILLPELTEASVP